MDNMNINNERISTVDENSKEYISYEGQRPGYINFQKPHIKKSRFKKVLPFIASTLISAIVGGAAGGAYVNYMVKDKYSYKDTNPITSSISNNNQIIQSGYTPPTNLIGKIAESVGPAIVGINTKVVSQGFFGQSIQGAGSGSGIIFDSKGYIVTNQHVIDGAKDITVTLPGRDPVKAQLVGADPTSDIAVLKINADNLPVAKFGDSSKVRVGDLAIAIGNPMGQEFAGSVTSGIISALNRNMNLNEDGYNRRYKLIQTDAAISPGNSGGALINENGEVIGINTIKIADAQNAVEGMGFAIPINEAKQIIDQLMKNGYVSRPYLGVSVVTVTDAMSKELNVPIGAGVGEVQRGSAAEAAGLRPNDVILEINGSKIKTSDDLLSELEKYKVGDAIRIKIWREGKELTLPATLGDRRKFTN